MANPQKLRLGKTVGSKKQSNWSHILTRDKSTHQVLLQEEAERLKKPMQKQLLVITRDQFNVQQIWTCQPSLSDH